MAKLALLGGAKIVGAAGGLKLAAGIIPTIGKAGEVAGKEAVAAESAVARGLPPLRQAYVDEVRALEDFTSGARLAGQDLETTARMAHAERNALKLKYRELSPPEMVQKFEQRNINRYGDPLGPSVEQLRASGKSWNDIIDSALRPGGKDLGY